MHQDYSLSSISQNYLSLALPYQSMLHSLCYLQGCRPICGLRFHKDVLPIFFDLFLHGHANKSYHLRICLVDCHTLCSNNYIMPRVRFLVFWFQTLVILLGKKRCVANCVIIQSGITNFYLFFALYCIYMLVESCNNEKHDARSHSIYVNIITI